LPILLFPLWWQIPTTADPDGTLRALHGWHIRLLTVLQMLGFGTVVLLIPAFAHLVAAIIYKLIGKPMKTVYVRACIVLLVLCPAYASIPATMRDIDYSGFERNAAQISSDLAVVEKAVREWKLQHGTFPEDIDELRTQYPTLPRRPLIAKLPDYEIQPGGNEPDSFVVFMRGYLWWDSGALLVYCPDNSCAEFGYGRGTYEDRFGDLIYSAYYRYSNMRSR
jgi:hypothetical protein